jgi:DNA polymerase III delta prime subunit
MNVGTNLKEWYYKKRGKTSKIFPVKVEKFRIKGSKAQELDELAEKKTRLEKEIKDLQDSEEPDEDKIEKKEQELEALDEDIEWSDVNIVFDSMDRGRTIIDEEEDGREKFQLMNEPQATGKVNYSDLDEYVREPLTSVVMIGRKKFVPVNREFMTGEEMNDGSGWPKLKYMLSLETYMDHMKEEWRLTTRIAENESDKWWEDRTIQAVMFALAMGIFFILFFYGAGEFYLEPFSEQLASLESTMNDWIQANGGVNN